MLQVRGLHLGSYQQRTRVEPASADGHGRPAGPQVYRREVRPHFCGEQEHA